MNSLSIAASDVHTKLYCDKCKKEITEGQKYYVLNTYYYYPDMFHLCTYVKPVVLCSKDCWID